MYLVIIKRDPSIGRDETIEVQTFHDAEIYLDEILPERLDDRYSFHHTDNETLVGYRNHKQVLIAEIIPSWIVSRATGIKYATI